MVLLDGLSHVLHLGLGQSLTLGLDYRLLLLDHMYRFVVLVLLVHLVTLILLSNDAVVRRLLTIYAVDPVE